MRAARAPDRVFPLSHRFGIENRVFRNTSLPGSPFQELSLIHFKNSPNVAHAKDVCLQLHELRQNHELYEGRRHPMSADLRFAGATNSHTHTLSHSKNSSNSIYSTELRYLYAVQAIIAAPTGRMSSLIVNRELCRPAPALQPCSGVPAPIHQKTPGIFAA